MKKSKKPNKVIGFNPYMRPPIMPSTMMDEFLGRTATEDQCPKISDTAGIEQVRLREREDREFLLDCARLGIFEAIKELRSRIEVLKTTIKYTNLAKGKKK